MIKMQLLTPLLLMMLAACAGDNNRYKDNANLERPPELIVDKQAAEQQSREQIAAKEPDADVPKKHHGKGLKSDIYKVEGSTNQFRLKRTFDEAWSLLNRAIQQNDLKVPDQDRSKGLYYAAYGNEFLMNTFSFLRDHGEQPTYLIKVEPLDEETQVTVTYANKDEQDDSVSAKVEDEDSSTEDQSTQLFELLFDTLHDDVKDE